MSDKATGKQQLAGERARATLVAIDKTLFDSRRLRFRRVPKRYFAPPEFLWPFANEWSAHLSVQALDGRGAPTHDHLGILSSYHCSTHDGPIRNPGYRSLPFFGAPTNAPTFYDDNAWIGLCLLRELAASGNEVALSLVRSLWSFIVSGWSTETDFSHPGGLFWKADGNTTTRHTCTNGPACELGASLSLLTGEEGPGEWALRIYAWTREALFGDDGLYNDKIDVTGRLDPTRWSYNQGVMIGSGVLLSKLTGDASYLSDAKQTASAASARYSPEVLSHQGPAFNAIYFRNLFLLNEVLGQSAGEQIAWSYADSMWREHRDEQTGLFVGGDSLLNGSAGMMEIFSLLAGASARP